MHLGPDCPVRGLAEHRHDFSTHARESLGSAVRQDCLSVLTFAMWSVVASEDMMLFMARNQGHYGG